MSEFNNRIDAQRKILQLVNKYAPFSEELFGLSQKTIDRWIMENNIPADSNLVALVRNASEKLFFLANKSQEQVTKEYKSVESEIRLIYKAIKVEISPRRAGKRSASRLSR